MKTIYLIDGAQFWTLEGFYGEVSRILIPECCWGLNLNAFDDILSGGFGTPDGGFIIRWQNSQISRQRLGYEETARQLRLTLLTCHPSARGNVTAKMNDAENNVGPTAFDWLVEIILDHCQGGKQSGDGIELQLV